MAGVTCGKLDLTKLPQDEIVTINDQAWLKADVDEKIYLVSGVPHVVIKFSDTCVATVCDDQQKLNPSLANLAGVRDSDKKGTPSGGGSQDKTRSLPSSITNENQNVNESQKGLDANSINVYSWYGAAVKPASAVIPLKSNVKTYGPYASSNFGSSGGGTQVEVNSDLAPWVFGSIAAMNAAGSSIVESSAIGLVKAETGSITIPGLPTAAFSSLGIALNGAGPTLSAINFTYGSGGITTNYEFRTYTPKFGGLNRHIIDKIKSVSKNRTEQIRFLRNNQINQNKIGRKIQNIRNQTAGNKSQGTLQRVIMGEIYDWESLKDSSSQCTIVGIDTLRKSVGEMSYDYDKKAYISLDGLYGPVSKDGDGGLPRYASFEKGIHAASPDLPQPPYAIDDSPGSEGSNPFVSGLNQNNLEITQDYMDPLNNPFEDEGHHHSGSGAGHVIDLVGRENQIPEKGMITNFYDLDDDNRYSEDYRFLGMRGPIVLHSWGYDTQGKPIPNEADTEQDTKSGQFKDTELKDKFLGDWLAKPATWPVAPIDFRFDRKRGVWVSPPGYKVVVAILDEKLEKYSTAKASLINKDTENDLEFGPPLYNKEGEEVKATEEDTTEAKIKVADRLGVSYAAGTRMYCYYDTFNSEYIVLQGAKASSIRFRLIDLCNGSAVEPDYGDDWTKHAGYGDKFPNNHILGIRINCEGDPINNRGELVNHEDIFDEEKQKDILVNLYDTSGKFGAANAYYDANGGASAFSKWKNEAATGFALICDPSPEYNCALGEVGTQCSSVNPENYDSYDIIFLDGYARFVECELTQKLYMNEEDVENEFPDDEYKGTEPEGNAAATIKHFYGDPGNGIEPKFYNNDGGGLKEIDFRVFDPFKDTAKQSNPFYNLKAGDKVLAVFDENRKKYIIYQSLRKDEKIIKFALVDNKDIGDRLSKAVLVDPQGYPIDLSGKQLTAENFDSNFINVTDSFAIHGYGTTTYNNWGTTGFGPALGSADFDEHISGIPLAGGDWTGTGSSGWTGGPFMGYALQRVDNINSSASGDQFVNEIIFLESFAKEIAGKIASLYPVVDSSYYLGALYHDNGVEGGFVNGRIPFTRDAISENDKANLRVLYPLDQHAGGKYITGDFYEDYTSGDVYNNVDGCRFIAKLDHVRSKVNNGDTERLYYTIIEVDNIANKGQTSITKQEFADKLNAGEVQETTSESFGINSEYLNGFMWDKEHSKTHYEQIKILNRYDWVNKGLILQWDDSGIKHIKTNLVGYDQDGSISYQVDFAGTIAQVGEFAVTTDLAGRFGAPNAVSSDDKKIGKFNTTLFYHGLHPLQSNLSENDQPVVNVNNPWMVYDGSKISALWNETKSANIKDGQYEVIYAREAPIIITGEATSKFTPEEDSASVKISGEVYSSCPGHENVPISSLVTKAGNPMGYGAKEGDFVTLQRVYLPSIIDGANYKYIVIGTGAPPE